MVTMTGGNGGNGASSSISGTSVNYGGAGGGTGGTGSVGGGGNGGLTSGAPGTGGGGGGPVRSISKSRSRLRSDLGIALSKLLELILQGAPMRRVERGCRALRDIGDRKSVV